MTAESGRILITGGGQGLGQALARAWARAGWRVAVGDIDPGKAAATADDLGRLGGEGMALAMDVTSDEAVEYAADRISAEWGGLDILVNNAGVGSAGTVERTDLSVWEWTLSTNVLGVARVSHAFLPMLTNGTGHVVNIASAAGFVSAPGMAAYNASKAAVISISESLRTELAGRGIGVTVVCPSFFRTGLLENFRGPEAARAIAERAMQRSGLSADDVAARVCEAVERRQFLLAPHAESRRLLAIKRFAPEWYFRILRKRSARFLAAQAPEPNQPHGGDTG
jgi:NAD(P)-dependent dehydrogenase (short-subunit alcohol dehydrogenase family)